MTTVVFVCVILAALLHAVWNALVRGADDKTLNLAAVVLGHTPLALLILPFVPSPDAASLPYLLTGLCLHFGYQLFLLFAYRVGELTQVYPIARGSAPLIVTAVSITILGVSLTGLQLFGVFAIAAGIISIALVRQQDGLRNPKATALALVTGCFIASYSLIDGTGARLAGSPFSYYAWLTIGNAVVFFVYLMIVDRRVLRALPRKGKRVFLIGGSASFVAYALVTWAFTQAPIALVTALRETSIVFALIIGVFFLKEKLNLAKVISTVVTLFGAALLKLARI